MVRVTRIPGSGLPREEYREYVALEPLLRARVLGREIRITAARMKELADLRAAAIREQHDSGSTMQEIGDALGLSKQMISRLLQDSPPPEPLPTRSPAPIPGSTVGVSSPETLEEDAMARTKKPPQVAVEPRPGGKWAVQKDGTKRASSVHDTKAPAVKSARSQARREGAELVIKDQRGRVQSKDSHGRDPHPPKG